MPTQIISRVGPRPPCPPSAGAHGGMSCIEITKTFVFLDDLFQPGSHYIQLKGVTKEPAWCNCNYIPSRGGIKKFGKCKLIISTKYMLHVN